MTTPEYRKPRNPTPQSPSGWAEHAMCAAANALITPLGESGRFEMMAFVKEAMDALDKCARYDPITVEIVRRKVGEAQRRHGF